LDPTTGFFYLFAAVTVFAASRVVTAQNPVHSVLFLVLTFVSAAAIWLLLQAEFLAIVLVLVYVGAVMVLFLFVVMMLDINVDQVRHGFWRSLPVALFVGGAIVIELSLVLWVQFGPVKSADAPALPLNYSNTAALGHLLYTDYVYPLEIAGVILLVAMVAAIALTLRHRKDAKGQTPGDQVKVRSADRLRIVHVDPISARAAAGRAAAASAAGAAGGAAAASASDPAVNPNAPGAPGTAAGVPRDAGVAVRDGIPGSPGAAGAAGTPGAAGPGDTRQTATGATPAAAPHLGAR
jgi:NADH-quinone oxidoreductase subunit J